MVDILHLSVLLVKVKLWIAVALFIYFTLHLACQLAFQILRNNITPAGGSKALLRTMKAKSKYAGNDLKKYIQNNIESIYMYSVYGQPADFETRKALLADCEKYEILESEVISALPYVVLDENGIKSVSVSRMLVVKDRVNTFIGSCLIIKLVIVLTFTMSSALLLLFQKTEGGVEFINFEWWVYNLFFMTLFTGLLLFYLMVDHSRRAYKASELINKLMGQSEGRLSALKPRHYIRKADF
ncbi:hypothetical protein E4656_02175 [Natronospirillum operosum]|uniref:Uncharacterized protein n=1 Tax=Natronospirillum operosum TaxID=2759953 RepID=A0A4Z0W9E6_9GAMM|nr:hypothetical protein [Natronospirillum operosum]TGG95249.1 hypothetical protein E4656_02175 [Natronospirillum operosum]